jgi:hypothetical protein
MQKQFTAEKTSYRKPSPMATAPAAPISLLCKSSVSRVVLCLRIRAETTNKVIDYAPDAQCQHTLTTRTDRNRDQPNPIISSTEIIEVPSTNKKKKKMRIRQNATPKRITSNAHIVPQALPEGSSTCITNPAATQVQCL